MKHILVFVCLLGVASCGGSGGGSSPAATAFQLIGKIVVEDPLDADITITVGDTSATAKADAEGVFSFNLDLGPDALSLPVALLGKLTGERDFIELGSNLGTAEELIAMTGPDETLDFADSPRVNISTLTTAEFALLDKVGLESTKAFDFAVGVDPGQALTLAAALQLIIDAQNAFVLPEGSQSTLDFARDEDTRDTFIADVQLNNPAELESARQEILGNPDIVAPPVATGPEIFKLGNMQAARRICWNGCPASQGVDFNDDGTAQAYDSVFSSPGTWVLNGTRRELRYDAARSFDSFLFDDCDGDGSAEQFPVTFIDDGIDLVEIGGDAVAVTYLSREIYNCSAIPDASFQRTTVFDRLDGLTTNFAADDFADRGWALDVVDLPVALGQGSVNFEAVLKSDVVTFAADGNSQNLILGTNQQWLLSEGVLQLDQGGSYTGRVELIEALDAVNNIVVATYTVGESKYLSLGYAYRQNPAAGFDAQMSAGTYYWNGLGPDQSGDLPPDDDPRLQGDRFVLFADGNGEGFVSDDIVNGEVIETTSSSKIVGWQVDGSGELRYSRYLDTSFMEEFCDPTSPDCFRFFDSRVVLVNRVADRLYTVRRRDTFESLDNPQTVVGRYQITQILEFEPAAP